MLFWWFVYCVQELFKRVVPYHCLGSIWSQRDKKGKEHLAPTIRATVTQFNRVTNCVISTCLSDRMLKPAQRARILEHWIQVARVSVKVIKRLITAQHASNKMLMTDPAGLVFV